MTIATDSSTFAGVLLVVILGLCAISFGGDAGSAFVNPQEGNVVDLYGMLASFGAVPLGAQGAWQLISMGMVTCWGARSAYGHTNYVTLGNLCLWLLVYNGIPNVDDDD